MKVFKYITIINWQVNRLFIHHCLSWKPWRGRPKTLWRWSRAVRWVSSASSSELLPEAKGTAMATPDRRWAWDKWGSKYSSGKFFVDLYSAYRPIPSVQDFIGSLRLKMYIINSPKLKSLSLSCTVMNPTGLLRYISSRGSIILSVLDAGRDLYAYAVVGHNPGWWQESPHGPLRPVTCCIIWTCKKWLGGF